MCVLNLNIDRQTTSSIPFSDPVSYVLSKLLLNIVSKTANRSYTDSTACWIASSLGRLLSMLVLDFTLFLFMSLCNTSLHAKKSSWSIESRSLYLISYCNNVDILSR